MRFSKNIFARLLIWLAAIAIPVQGFSAAACGCGTHKKRSPKETQSACCCSQKQNQSHTCCGAAETPATCKCKADCRCGTSNQPGPAIPPRQNTLEERLSNDWIPVVSSKTSFGIHTFRQHQKMSFEYSSTVALNRCVSLCRLTI